MDISEISHRIFSTEINYGINLLQLRGGLLFGTDVLLLAAFLPRAGKAAELGCGSGVISLIAAAGRRIDYITAAEIQPEYCAIARENVRINTETGLLPHDSMKVVEADIRDWRAVGEAGEYDVVFSNPPYMRTDTGKRNETEEKYIARHEVHGDISDFCLAASRLLHPGGRFCCVYRPDRLIDLICAMREAQLEPKRLITVYRDVYHQPSLVLAEGIRDGKPSLFTPPPLILYNDDGKMTDEFKKITDDGIFDERYIRK